jgi:hypothetical protein
MSKSGRSSPHWNVWNCVSQFDVASRLFITSHDHATLPVHSNTDTAFARRLAPMGRHQ